MYIAFPRLTRFVLWSLLLFSLSGCYGIFAAEGISSAVSGKTVSDHVVSYMSGKECLSTRTADGLTYCVEDEVQHVEPTLYCYKTLANVSCYTTPDPSRSPDQIIQPGGYTSPQ